MRHRSIAVVIATASFVLAAPARAQQKNPLENAKAGQWLLQKSTAGGMSSHIYQWVSKVEGKKVTIRTQMLKADKKTAMMAATEATIDLAAPAPSGSPAAPASGPAPTISDDEIEVKGKKVKCKKTEVTVGPNTSVTWTSESIPLSGLAKMVSKNDGNVVAELETVDYGDTGGADKAVGAAGAPGGEGATTPPGEGATPGAAGDKKWSVGQQVGAKWGDARYYPGKISAIEGDKYSIEFEDGDKGTVGEADLLKACTPDELSVGDAVWAVWNGKRFFEGTVESKDDKGCVIKWADGDTPAHVKFGHITKR